MQPEWGMAALWILFGGTHVGLAARAVREPLVKRTGEIGFALLFSLVAAASFTLLVSYYAAHRFEGAPGLALGRFEALRWLLLGAITAGTALAAAGLVSYPRSPYALLAEATRAPRGVERITRHPFFAGVTLFALAHALLATRLVGAIFAAGLACLAIAGARHQDAKLLARRGQPYADYLAVTSAIPFGAILAGRQRLVWHELPVVAIAAGILVAIALRAVHDGIFAWGGALVTGSVLGGAAWATARSWRRARRHPTTADGGEDLEARERWSAAKLH
jgi:uncharacterized membrane protein